MAATIVQNVAGSSLAGNDMQVTLNSVVAGNCIILVCSYLDVNQAASAVPATPTSGNGTFQLASAPACQNGSSIGTGSPIFFIPNCNAGTHLLTFNPHSHAGALYSKCSALEISGLTATPLDKATSNGSSAAASSTTGNTNTTTALAQASELVIVSLAISAGTGLANAGISSPATASYTALFAFQDTSTEVGAQHSYKEPGVTTGQIGTWTWTADATMQNWQGNIATFKESSGAPVASRIFLLGAG